MYGLGQIPQDEKERVKRLIESLKEIKEITESILKRYEDEDDQEGEADGN